MLHKQLKYNVIDYILVILFVLTSGAKLFLVTLTPGVAFLFFFIFSFFYKYVILQNKQNNYSLHYILFVIALMLIGDLTYLRTYRTNASVGYIVALAGSYFCISSFNFYRFRRILLNVVFVITLSGILVFVLNEFGVLPTRIVVFPNISLKLFGPFVLGWPFDFHRYAGIWHEPGACQIVLNTVLWLFVDKFIKWNWESEELYKIIVIVIGLLMTLSTGGYMTLALLIATIGVSNKIKSKSMLLIYPLVLILVVVALYMLYNSDVVQHKLFNETHGSLITRKNDSMAMLEMLLSRPLLGYGVGSDEFWTVSELLGNRTNSNGLLAYAASLGIVWLLCFLGYAYYRIKKMQGLNYLIHFMTFVAFLMLQSNECYIEYPITNIFIFSFGSYSVIKV